MAPPPPDLIDREREWQTLQAAWESDRPELVFVLGRRRVGKSFVLVPFAEAVGGIYYQATLRTEAEQLAALGQIVAERFDDAALRQTTGFTSWEALFDYLIAKAAGAPFLVVIDEVPYLEAAAPAFPTILQSIVDHRLRGTRLKIVLSGSHVSAMKRLEEVDQPLYARRTARVWFRPFPYTALRAFVPRYDARDLLRAYGIFGGVAGHLALLSADAPLVRNACTHVLDPAARLYDEAERMLDGFVVDAAVPYSILDAIAAGQRTWSGITKRLGKPAGSLSRPMAWLIDMEIVRRDVPVTVARPAKTKRALYTLTDPYVAFWHRFVSPLAETGVSAIVPPERLWEQRVAPSFDDYMGGVFEEVCRAALLERPGLAPFAPARVGSWWTADSREQVDVVALGERGEVLAGECKWGPIGAADLATLRRRAALIAAELGTDRAPRLALFTGSGVADDAVRRAAAAGEVVLFDAADLFPAGV